MYEFDLIIACRFKDHYEGEYIIPLHFDRWADKFMEEVNCNDLERVNRFFDKRT